MLRKRSVIDRSLNQRFMTFAQSARGLIGRTVEVDVLDVSNKLLDHGVVIESISSLMDGIEARVRLGGTRHKERAAIGRGLA